MMAPLKYKKPLEFARHHAITALIVADKGFQRLLVF